jgi:hypothetical protein
MVTKLHRVLMGAAAELVVLRAYGPKTELKRMRTCVPLG